MTSVFVCTLLLALLRYGYAVIVCDNDLSHDSTLKPSCTGNDGAVLWPNYLDYGTYHKCITSEKTQLQKCPPNTYFTYYFQQCTPCSKFIPPPTCEFLQGTTNVECIPHESSTTTQPDTTTTIKPTVNPSEGTTLPSDTETTSSEDIPTAHVVITPAPGVPTPPSENVTPPSIPGQPPLLTTPQDI